MAITRDEMMPALLQVCPSFEPIYEAFLEEWKDDEKPPYYLALADFARHLIEMLERGEVQSFPAIFREIDRIEQMGDAYVSNAIVAGLLEEMQNDNLHKKNTEPEDFRCFLSPRSEVSWNKFH